MAADKQKHMLKAIDSLANSPNAPSKELRDKYLKEIRGRS